MGFESCWERIRRGCDLKTQTSLASFLGIRDASVTGAKQRDSFPADWAVKIAGEYGLSTDWILTGEGPITRESGVSEAGAVYNSTKTRDDYIYVPRYDVQASAGHGAINDQEDVVDHLAFKRDWVKNKLGVDGKDLALITAKGDSMEPTIEEDDLLLLNTAINEVQDDGIYCIKNEFRLQIKRIQRMIGKEIVVKSDNPAYQPFTVGPDQLECLEVVGRVVWYGRQI